MEKIIRELEELGSEIKKAEQDVSTQEGRLQVMNDNLFNNFKLNSIEEAKIELEKLNIQKEKSDVIINEKFSKLKENYEW